MERLARIGLPLALALALTASGCSGSSDGDSPPALTLAVTDAASDELVKFVVAIDSVHLERATGGVVSVLPDPVAVDFAQLEDLSRVLNVMSIPAGLYVGAEIALDFTDADVVLIGDSATPPATILDSEGNPLTGLVTLPVELAGNFDAALNRNHVLELDLDLDQSVQVDLLGNTVTVEPSLVVRFDRNDPKELAIGGGVRGVDELAESFEIGLDAALGSPIPVVDVDVDASTVFQIDGVPSQGAAGLAELANLSQGSWVQAFGSADPVSARFLALTVEAGRGSYNGGSDIVEGHVVARTGGAGADAVLTVLGHSNNSLHTVFSYNRQFVVNTSFAGTKVVRRGSVQAFDTDDLNIGQLVRVFGVLSGNTLDASTPTDVVRMQPTRLLGFADDPPASGLLTFDLERIDLRLENAFTWSDSGAPPTDPLLLVADVGSLGNGLSIGVSLNPTPIAASGFFSAIDDAGPDFVALSLENRLASDSLFVIHDRTDGLSVVPTIPLAGTEISFAISGGPVAGELALIDQGFVGSMPLPTSPPPRIEPRNNFGVGYFTIRDRTLGSVTTYLLFDEFAAGLDAKLMSGAVLYNVGAVGLYAESSNTLQSALVGVVVD